MQCGWLNVIVQCNIRVHTNHDITIPHIPDRNSKESPTVGLCNNHATPHDEAEVERCKQKKEASPGRLLDRQR